jgi:hypothetical protein
MSKVKDKLSASMRTVKSGQEPAATEPASAASDKPASKPAAKKTPAPRKPAGKAPTSGKTTVPGDVPESGTALFPTRVWPD